MHILTKPRSRVRAWDWVDKPDPVVALKTDRASKIDPAREIETQIDDGSNGQEVWCCIECAHPITRVADRIEVAGRHRHVFTNPHGYVYQIGCFIQAPGCALASLPSTDFSWFPGYAWQIALCGQCFTLLGWVFRASQSGFFGLIVDKLVRS